MTVKTEERCPICDHYMGMHFLDTDEIGSWGFCGIPSCECFWSNRREDDAPPLEPV